MKKTNHQRVWSYLRAMEGFATAQEIADALDVNEDSTRYYLRWLYRAGMLYRRDGCRGVKKYGYAKGGIEAPAVRRNGEVVENKTKVL